MTKLSETSFKENSLIKNIRNIITAKTVRFQRNAYIIYKKSLKNISTRTALTARYSSYKGLPSLS